MAPAELAALQAELGPTYRLERELARGGMSVVYLALDTKHGRPVALKLLHAQLGRSVAARRFRREIALVARLQHPHILALLDSGETESGQLWFTMPYVEGETLRDRLRREPRLPVDVAARIAHEAALALGHAHGQGVIHRDVKPENILLTRDEQALVADFGVARAMRPEESGALTVSGAAIGTPRYMSPEQAMGDRPVDARTDVYALGAVLYEMLAGAAPYTGWSARQMMAASLSGQPPSVRRERPDVPSALDATIRKALAFAPPDRYQTGAELAQALDPARARRGKRWSR
jgi:serine/threonine-protein kinase